MKWLSVGVVCVILAISGCRKAARAPVQTDQRAALRGQSLPPLAVPGADAIELDEDVDDLLRVADSVQVARIHTGYIEALQPKPTTLLEYDVAGGDCLVDSASPEFDADVARKLAEILLDKSSYRERKHGLSLLASGLFKPRVAFSISAGDERSTLFWDPELDFLCVLKGDTRGICGNLGDYGHDVSPARHRLIPLVKDLLSSDPEIQELQVEREPRADLEGAGSPLGR